MTIIIIIDRMEWTPSAKAPLLKYYYICWWGLWSTAGCTKAASTCVVVLDGGQKGKEQLGRVGRGKK